MFHAPWAKEIMIQRKRVGCAGVQTSTGLSEKLECKFFAPSLGINMNIVSNVGDVYVLCG